MRKLLLLVCLGITISTQAQITATQFKKTVDSLGLVIKALRSKDTLLTNQIASAVSVNNTQNVSINNLSNYNGTQDARIKKVEDTIKTIRNFVVDTNTMVYKGGILVDTFGINLNGLTGLINGSLVTKIGDLNTQLTYTQQNVSYVSNQLTGLAATVQTNYTTLDGRITPLETWRTLTQSNLDTLNTYMNKLKSQITITLTGQLSVQ